jgi:hypothetical protein
MPRQKSVHRGFGDNAESSQANPMSKARGLINAHLYPVLATFVVIDGAMQIAPIANKARHFNQCAKPLRT